VPWPLLQAIADTPGDALHRDLAHLQAAEFLYETRLFPEREYAFRHALTHEGAYGGLLRERQRLLHGRTVAAIEQREADHLADQVERLAHHALRGEVWNKAVAYSQQAGKKAMVRSACREAAGYFEQALGVLPHLSEQHDTRDLAIDLRLALRIALFPFGDWRRILVCLHEVETLAAALDDPRRRGQVAVCHSNSTSWAPMTGPAPPSNALWRSPRREGCRPARDGELPPRPRLPGAG
jgi:hypothetical protein